MPNRILKDSICTSENLNCLSSGAEIFFYRLLVQCDDYGCFDGRLPIIRARCFPLRQVTEKDIQKWLAELITADIIVTYTSDKKPYLQFKTWKHHQQIRAKRHKYPYLLSDDSNGNQPLSDAPPIQSNTNQSESESESESKSIPATAVASDFHKAQQEFIDEFCKLTGLPELPHTNKSFGPLWGGPSAHIVKVLDGKANEFLLRAVEKLRNGGMTISSPKSVVNTIMSLYGESHSATGKRVYNDD